MPRRCERRTLPDWQRGQDFAGRCKVLKMQPLGGRVERTFHFGSSPPPITFVELSLNFSHARADQMMRISMSIIAKPEPELLNEAPTVSQVQPASTPRIVPRLAILLGLALLLIP